MTQIRRVPLTFEWPLHQVWEGYLLPKSLRLPSCPDCVYGGSRATGLSPEAWAVESTFYALDVSEPLRSQIAWHDKIGQAEVDHLVRKGRLDTWVADPDGGDGQWVTTPRTAEEVNAAQRTQSLFGSHDGLNRWLLVKYRCKRLGIRLNCATCGGKTHVGTTAQIAAYKAWEPTDPPAGEGWQVWEDISEGSPISPVHVSADALVDWLTGPASATASHRYPLTRPEAQSLVESGESIGSAALINGVFHDGDRAVAAIAKES